MWLRGLESRARKWVVLKLKLNGYIASINLVPLILSQLSFWNSASMNFVQSSQLLSISNYLKEFFHHHSNKLLFSLFSKNHLCPLIGSSKCHLSLKFGTLSCAYWMNTALVVITITKTGNLNFEFFIKIMSNPNEEHIVQFATFLDKSFAKRKQFIESKITNLIPSSYKNIHYK